jgi:LysR family glycine cleavage system transcriptional activator
MPPLPAIRVFDAVARAGNFTRAAAELNMTQSAVSYQIRLLEDFVGQPLFRRQARGVSLSPRGAELAPLAARSLADLARGFGGLREARDGVLAISTMQTIAGNWLARRLGEFQLRHPDIAVRLDVSMRLVDFDSEDIDVAIRSGKGNWPGLTAHRLFGQDFVAVASPAYLAREGHPATPADMLRHVLISPSDDWWNIWFRTAGVATPIRIGRPGIDVETQQMAGSVAMAGHGIALVTPRFEADCLATGALVPLFGVVGDTGFAYYVVYPRARAAERKIRLFRDWVLAEAAADQSGSTTTRVPSVT